MDRNTERRRRESSPLLRLMAVIEAATITGPAKNLLDFALGARAHGIEITIVTFVRGGSSNLFLDTARGRGIAVETVAERGAFDRAAISGLAALVERTRPDIVQTHAVKSHFLARLAGVGRQSRWVAFHHGYTWPDFRARLYNQLDRWSLRAPDRILTVSGSFRDELAAHGAELGRIEVIHNAIRPGWGTARDPELRRSLGIASERNIVLIVGRLSREKDHITLIEAVQRLRERDLHLLIVGDGPERVRIEVRVAELGLTGRVTMTSQVASAEPYYGIAAVAVLSSLSEGSPNALLEAMAAGVPVVATRVGGVPEIAEDGEHALLVRPGDTAAMAGALDRILSDPESGAAMAARARVRVLERHTPEARTARLAGIYRNLVREGDSEDLRLG